MKSQYRMLMLLLLSSVSMGILGQPGKKGGCTGPACKIGSKGGARAVSGAKAGVSAKAAIATNDVLAMNPYQIEQLDINKISRQQAEDLLIVALFAGGKYKRQAAQQFIDTYFGKQNWAQHSADFIGAIRSEYKELGDPKWEMVAFDALFSGSKVKRAQAQKEINSYLKTQADFDKIRMNLLRKHAGQFIEQFTGKFKKEAGKEEGKEEAREEEFEDLGRSEEILSLEKRAGGQYSSFKQPGGALTYEPGSLTYKPGKEQKEYEEFGQEEFPFETHFAWEEERPLSGSEWLEEESEPLWGEEELEGL